MSVPVARRSGRSLSALLLSMVIVFAVAGPAAAQRGAPSVPSEETPSFDFSDLPFGGAAEADRGVPADGVAADAVDDGDRTVQIIDADVSNHPEVRVVAAVPPALAGELAADSFALTEQGQFRSVEVTKLRDAIEVVIVVDTSGSMDGAPIAAARDAAKSFVDSLDSGTRVAVVGFGEDVRTAAGFDSTHKQARAAIDGLSAGGKTSLYDALVAASAAFDDNGARRFVVVLSDGADTASTADVVAAAAALSDASVALYGVTLQSAEADFAGLAEISDLVDGHLVAASDAESLDATYKAIASRLTNQYRLTYSSRVSGDARLVVSVAANDIVASAATDISMATGEPGVGDGATAVAARVGDPEIFEAGGTGLLKSSFALYLGAAGLFVAVGFVLFTVFSIEPKGPTALQRLNLGRKTGEDRRSGFAAIADRASSAADRILESRSQRGALDAALEKAGMDMRPGEYVVATAAAAIGLSLLALIVFGTVAGGIAFALGLAGGRVFVNMKVSKRQKRFAGQLGDTLMMVAGSLRAGHGIAEAIDTVANQAESPTGDEFGRAVAESRIGRDMVDSLHDIADRTGSEDFVWVVRAISINRELGGDLAEILDNVGETIRDRNRLRDQVRALSAEGKVSAMILFAMPILVAIWVRISNPEYMDSMMGEPMGKVVFGVAIGLMVAGGLWLKKLVKVEF